MHKTFEENMSIRYPYMVHAYTVTNKGITIYASSTRRAYKLCRKFLTQFDGTVAWVDLLDNRTGEVLATYHQAKYVPRTFFERFSDFMNEGCCADEMEKSWK